MRPPPPVDPDGPRRFQGRRLLVIGDLILDRYLSGRVERISPEAPVPVVRLEGRSSRVGGAANVAANVAALGGRPVLAGVAGDDEAGRDLVRRLAAAGVDDVEIATATGRTTTVKTRVLARHQQVVRIDEEETEPVAGRVADELAERAVRRLAAVDGVLVSDYDKGTLTGAVLAPLLAAAAERGLPVVVDPKQPPFTRYAPARVLTPNTAELARAVAAPLGRGEAIEEAARRLLEEARFEAVVVTRGEEGMAVVPRAGEAVAIAAEEREVFDVTGAGDTVAATLALGLAGGLDLVEAAVWANRAAAIAVTRLGTAAVTAAELMARAAGAGVSRSERPGGGEVG